MKESDPKVGDGISAQRSSWRFDGAVPGKFDSHVSRSIPGYEYGHDRVVEIATSILSRPTIAYELGCSTGVLTEKLAACAQHKDTKVIGIDPIVGMLEIASQRCEGFSNVSFEKGDVLSFPYQPTLFMVSYYTLQFVPMVNRRTAVQRIFDSLEDGGVFILFEKIYFNDETENSKMNEQYVLFKRSQGYTDEEIRSKSESLEGVLVPQTEFENKKMLDTAGFESIETIYSQMCWQGYIARK